MRETKKRRLESRGWRVGTAEEFLGLSTLESEYIALKMRLAEGLQSRRKKLRLTQVALAKRIGSSQSRVAKMESGDPSVSTGLMLRALLAMGASRGDLALLIAPPRTAARRKMSRARTKAGASAAPLDDS